MTTQKPVLHPMASLIGLKTPLMPDSTNYFYPDPTKQSVWEVARIDMIGENIIQFFLRDGDCNRDFSAKFDERGNPLALECSTGMPTGKTYDVAMLFCQEMRHALPNMILPH